MRSGVKVHGGRFGYGVVETTLITIIIIILAATTWFVHASSTATRKTLANTTAVAHAPVQTPKANVASFAECKSASNSKLVETFPEQCVMANGVTFTNPDSAAAKAASDSLTPAAGTCQTANGTVVTVTLNNDVPSPRCSQVTAGQSLTVVNPGTQSVTIKLGEQTITIAAGQSGSIPTSFGDYLQPGDHVMQTGMYGGSGPEIYLPAS